MVLPPQLIELARPVEKVTVVVDDDDPSDSYLEKVWFFGPPDQLDPEAVLRELGLHCPG